MSDGSDDRSPTRPRGAQALARAWAVIRPALQRGALAALPALVVAGLVALLASWLDDSRLVLDYLRTLVWPLVVISALWWLREPLRAKFADLLKVEGFGGALSFADASNRDLQDDARSAVRVLLGDESQSPPVAAHNVLPDPVDAPADAPPGAPATPPASENERREAIEGLMRESAAWGYDMAKVGFTSRPVPVIAWDAQGRPEVLYGRAEDGATGPAAVARRRAAQREVSVGGDASRRLEKEIQRLERELDAPTTPDRILRGHDRALENQLQRLRHRLRQIDPASPWAGLPGE